MTKTILQKITLTAVAMAASLALAQAGTAPRFSAAIGNHRAHVKNPLHIFPQMLDDNVYKWDDGSSEDAIAFGVQGVNNAESAWFNQFTVVAGAETITSLDIVWGTPANSTPANQLNGQPVIICIWNDPNNDGNPNDSTLIASVNGTISSANTDTFVTYTFDTPVNIGPAGTSFFVGDVTPAYDQGELFFQGIDETNPQGHSWVAGNSTGDPVDYMNLGNNDTLGTIDSFGLPGNWLIRANGTSGGGGGGLTLDSAVSRKVQGDAGTFDLNLPLTGTPAIEDRGGQARYTIVMTFNNNVTSVDGATTSCGNVGQVTANGKTVTINITKVNCDGSDITVTATGVHDDQGNTLDSAPVTFGLLIGDVNADGRVDGADADLVRTGHRVTRGTFRNDVNVDGKINRNDVKVVRLHRGDSLP